jgi:hypothetical protein
MKAMLKSEIADAAGVSLRTLSRWLHNPYMREQLIAIGEPENCKKLSPKAVKLICDHYAIDLD